MGLHASIHTPVIFMTHKQYYNAERIHIHAA